MGKTISVLEDCARACESLNLLSNHIYSSVIRGIKLAVGENEEGKEGCVLGEGGDGGKGNKRMRQRGRGKEWLRYHQSLLAHL